MSSYLTIQSHIGDGRLEEAVTLIQEALGHNPHDARLYYLRGRACMKQGRWGDAISNFLRSEQIEPDGPAREAREMLEDIMAFYNKDMYNQ